MSITGGIKFFDQSKALIRDGASITASSNQDLAPFVLTNDRYFDWESLGSDDTTLETLTITFEEQTIDRIFLLGHNFKEYNIKYLKGVWTDFTNVSDIDGTLAGGITDNAYDKDTSYYEFDAVTTTSVKLEVLKTQTANDEKSLITFYVTEEIGTFDGYPTVKKETYTRNERKVTTQSGKANIQKSYDTVAFNMSFKTYPLQSDYDTIESLYNRDDNFLVWLCGGDDSTDTTKFRISRMGWRLRDVYAMQVSKDYSMSWRKGVRISGWNNKLSLLEAI